MSRFSERFEIDEESGSFKMTSVGCMMRWDNWRAECENRSPETLRGYGRARALHDYDESHIPEDIRKEIRNSLKITKEGE